MTQRNKIRLHLSKGRWNGSKSSLITLVGESWAPLYLSQSDYLWIPAAGIYEKIRTENHAKPRSTSFITDHSALSSGLKLSTVSWHW